MRGLVLTFPILADKVEAWRRFCQELTGSRQQMYLASRRRLGITYERLALVETAFGATTVTTLEVAEVGWALERMITSDVAFDHWYWESMQAFHGIRLAGYENSVRPASSPQNQELLFEWRLSANIGTRPPRIPPSTV